MLEVDDKSQKLFTRRALLLGGGKTLLMSSLIARMYYLQVEMSDHFKVLSDNNRVLTRLIIPPRGHFIDRKGRILATNVNTYQAVVQRHVVDDLGALIAQLTDLLNLTEEELERIKSDTKRIPRFIPLKIKDALSWDEVARLELRLPNLTGLRIERNKTRHYKFPLSLCHVLGYVSTVSEKDKGSGDEQLLMQPGFRLGKGGLEKQYELDLRGKAGIKQVEINAARRVVRELDTKTSAPGQDLKLTLDFDLQQRLMERLKPEVTGAVVIIDPRNGDILALCSEPTYDTNKFTNGITSKDWKGLLTNEHKPLLDRATLGMYAPGSTFKMMVGLAALEAGIISTKTRFSCPGYIMLGRRKFRCWKRGGHGSMNISSAIKQSCDVFFYNTAALIGPDKIADMCHKFGLGVATGIDMPVERTGLIPTEKWKYKRYKDNWRKGDSYNTGIGQGYVLTTPLQLAVMTARIANYGKMVVPRLIRPEREPLVKTMDVNPKNIDIVRQGMIDVVQSGTAARSRINEEGKEMAGKTGTAQVINYTAEARAKGRHKSSTEWKYRDHALFVGFSPLVDPKFAIAVVIEHGGSGSRAAAPIAKEMMLAAHELVKDI